MVALAARFLGVQVLGLVMLWAWLLPALRTRLRPCWKKKSSEALLADESMQPSQRRSLQRQLQLQEYMASQMSERLLEHQHRLSTLRLRLTLLNTPRQAGFLRVRNAPDGPFDTYWAELRRDKKVYFFSHTAPQGSMPLFALELARVESAKVVEVDGHSVGRPLIPKAPLLQLILSDLGGGRIQILNHAISFARGTQQMRSPAGGASRPAESTTFGRTGMTDGDGGSIAGVRGPRQGLLRHGGAAGCHAHGPGAVGSKRATTHAARARLECPGAEGAARAGDGAGGQAGARCGAAAGAAAGREGAPADDQGTQACPQEEVCPGGGG